MDQSSLSSRAIMGMYFARLEAMPGASLIADISNDFTSDQSGETYNFLGQSPVMREWIGGRQAKGFSGQGVTIVNKHYEATIDDPGAYTAPWKVAFDVTWDPDGEIQEYICQENNRWGSGLADGTSKPAEP